MSQARIELKFKDNTPDYDFFKYMANEVHAPKINYSRKLLYRVFHDTKLKTGGRFYGGWWQSISSKLRNKILIDGMRTVEVDFTGFYANILYAINGSGYSGDPYGGIADEKYRGVIKRAFFAMVCASKPLSKPPNTLVIRQTGMTWKEISDAILSKHKQISHYFYSDYGRQLMRYDSDLAEDVMLTFLSKFMKPILPIHDSFRVHQHFDEQLMYIMFVSFERIFNQTIQIEPEYYFFNEPPDNTDDFLKKQQLEDEDALFFF